MIRLVDYIRKMRVWACDCDICMKYVIGTFPFRLRQELTHD